MAGIRSWRCSRCEDVASILEGSALLCGDCFLRQTGERIMAAAFLPNPPAALVRASEPTHVVTAEGQGSSSQ